MTHRVHIQKNKEILEKRSQIVRKIREFFWSKAFLEVETPLLVRLPGQEPYLDPMKLSIADESGNAYDAYLHTSPEYTMKKMLAAGFGNIFSICKTFRDRESFGGDHNPEFTMLEWYREGVDFVEIMDDVEDLLKFLGFENNNQACLPDRQGSAISDQVAERVHMRDLWKECVGVNLGEYLDTRNLVRLCNEKGFEAKETEPYEDLFYKIFLNLIEPKLKDRGVVIIHHYPAQMAALAKLSKEDPRYAERFELYIDGVEIANAFTELTDGVEQRKRLEEEREFRKQLGKDVYDFDEDFLEAVENLPDCAGIALGVDRLVQVLTGTKDINDVLSLPASLLFKNTP